MIFIASSRLATFILRLTMQSIAIAGSHSSGLSVLGEDQDVSGGTVTASKVMAGANGWLVIHRTDDEIKPGVVVGHSPLKKGENNDVTAILTEG